MKTDGSSLARHCLIGFVLAALIYVVAFSWIQHLRTRRGAWEVRFTTDAAGHPAVSIAEPNLGISNITFIFPGQQLASSNAAHRVVFEQPITNIPFGRVVYLDTTFLPGSLVFDWFGHQVQLLPRVLMIDGREVPWQSGKAFELPPR